MSANGNPKEEQHPALDWNDKGEARKWLLDLRTQVRDVAAVADDRTRSPGERRLGRHSAREMYVEAERAIEQLFDAALRGLLS